MCRQCVESVLTTVTLQKTSIELSDKLLTLRLPVVTRVQNVEIKAKKAAYRHLWLNVRMQPPRYCGRCDEISLSSNPLHSHSLQHSRYYSCQATGSPYSQCCHRAKKVGRTISEELFGGRATLLVRLRIKPINCDRSLFALTGRHVRGLASTAR